MARGNLSEQFAVERIVRYYWGDSSQKISRFALNLFADGVSRFIAIATAGVLRTPRCQT